MQNSYSHKICLVFFFFTMVSSSIFLVWCIKCNRRWVTFDAYSWCKLSLLGIFISDQFRRPLRFTNFYTCMFICRVTSRYVFTNGRDVTCWAQMPFCWFCHEEAKSRGGSAVQKGTFLKSVHGWRRSSHRLKHTAIVIVGMDATYAVFLKQKRRDNLQAS